MSKHWGASPEDKMVDHLEGNIHSLLESFAV